jgi:DNA-binding transcriptional ArsR family regulator
MAATTDDLLAAIDVRIAELQEARAVIVRVFGSGGGTVYPTKAPAKAARPADDTAPKAGRQARPTDARTRILDVLKKSTSPMGPSAVADAVGMNAPAVAFHLKKLAALGAAVKSGNGSATKYGAA